MKWDELPQQFFPKDFLDKLYRDYKVESAIQNSVHERLERSAKNWYYSRNAEDVDASPREVRQTLSKLTKHARALEKLLKNAPDAAWSELVSVSEYVNRNRYESGVHHDTHHQPEVGLIGRPAIAFVTDNNHDPFSTITIPDLKQAIGELASTASIASELIPTVKQGPQPDRPLQHWIIDMRNLWYRPLDRPFTVDEYKGEPRSEAAYFCVEVYAHLAPETPKSLVMHEMKKRIAKERELLIRFPHWKE